MTEETRLILEELSESKDHKTIDQFVFEANQLGVEENEAREYWFNVIYPFDENF